MDRCRLGGDHHRRRSADQRGSARFVGADRPGPELVRRPGGADCRLHPGGRSPSPIQPRDGGRPRVRRPADRRDRRRRRRRGGPASPSGRVGGVHPAGGCGHVVAAVRRSSGQRRHRFGGNASRRQGRSIGRSRRLRSRRRSTPDRRAQHLAGAADGPAAQRQRCRRPRFGGLHIWPPPPSGWRTISTVAAAPPSR